MIRFIEQRCTGKTLRLLTMAARENGVFVCQCPPAIFNRLEIEGIKKDFPNSTMIIISYEDFIKNSSNFKDKPIFIDEIEQFLRAINPMIYGWTCGLETQKYWFE